MKTRKISGDVGAAAAEEEGEEGEQVKEVKVKATHKENNKGSLENKGKGARLYSLVALLRCSGKIMGSLYGCEQERRKIYWDRQRFAGVGPATAALHRTSSLYLGDVNTYSSDAQISALFSCIGPVDHVRLGLHAQEKTPCGFAFVEFAHAKSALFAMSLANGFSLDARAIRTELDPGFLHGRQYGRGKKGGQAWKEKAIPKGSFGRPGRRGGQGQRLGGGRRRHQRGGGGYRLGGRDQGYSERGHFFTGENNRRGSFGRIPSMGGTGRASLARNDEFHGPQSGRSERPRKRPRFERKGDDERIASGASLDGARRGALAHRRDSYDSHQNPRFREDRGTVSDDDD